MFSGLLPIGSVVLLKNSSKRVIIIGVCQRANNNTETIYDYAGCIYPEGYMEPDKMFLFDGNDIDKIYAMGYQDEEQFGFKEKADSLMAEVRKLPRPPV